MSKLKVLINPNKTLRELSRDVLLEEIKTDQFQELIDDMFASMKEENGIGLAAPQIGKNIRLIVVDMPKGPEAFINPEIVKTSRRMIKSEEGCLSVPHIWGMVKRHKHVKLEALNRNGKKTEIKTGGLYSTVFQHEIDHLDGVLFIDKATELKELTPEQTEKLI